MPECFVEIGPAGFGLLIRHPLNGFMFQIVDSLVLEDRWYLLRVRSPLIKPVGPDKRMPRCRDVVLEGDTLSFPEAAWPYET